MKVTMELEEYEELKAKADELDNFKLTVSEDIKYMVKTNITVDDGGSVIFGNKIINVNDLADFINRYTMFNSDEVPEIVSCDELMFV